jgi:hypothetical protein
MNGLQGCLELYSTMNKSIDPSVRRVYFLLVGEQSLVDYWSWTCNYQLRPRMLVCAGGEFQVAFMPIACWPYGTFQPHQPFLRLMAPGQAIKAGMLAICGGFRSHLCFDDWLDRPCCRFSRHENAKALSCATVKDGKKPALRSR